MWTVWSAEGGELFDFDHDEYYYVPAVTNDFGVRPVIEISLSDVQ